MPNAYIARGKVAVNAQGLSVKAGDVVWLSYENEGGGWWQWTGNMEWAHPFKSEAAARKAVKECPGPWFNVPSPESVECVPAEYTPARKAELKISI
jgi:uncharacterized protein YfaQ (DUF2300 family)